MPNPTIYAFVQPGCPACAAFKPKLRSIAKEYERLYADPERSGPWGHDLRTLYFEGVTLAAILVEKPGDCGAAPAWLEKIAPR